MVAIVMVWFGFGACVVAVIVAVVVIWWCAWVGMNLWDVVVWWCYVLWLSVVVYECDCGSTNDVWVVVVVCVCMYVVRVAMMVG